MAAVQLSFACLRRSALRSRESSLTTLRASGKVAVNEYADFFQRLFFVQCSSDACHYAAPFTCDKVIAPLSTLGIASFFKAGATETFGETCCPSSLSLACSEDWRESKWPVADPLQRTMMRRPLPTVPSR